MSQNTLYISFSNSEVSWCKGWPIVPIQDSFQLKIVEDLSKELDFKIEYLTTSDQCNFEKSGVVVAIGSEVRREAELYAKLTNRSVVQVEVNDFNRISEINGLEIVISLSNKLCPEIFQNIYSLHHNVGFLIGSNLRDLRLNLLKSFIYFKFSAVSQPKSGFVYNSENFETFRDKNFDCFSSISDSKEILETIKSTRYDLLAVLGHSDGIDLNMHSNITSCNFKNFISDNSDRVPDCLRKKYCHRHSKDFSDRSLSDFIISPSDFRAKVFVSNTCRGYIFEGHVIDPKFGFATNLLDNYKVGCLVTSWDISIVRAKDLDEFNRLLLLGYTIGCTGPRIS